MCKASRRLRVYELQRHAVIDNLDHAEPFQGGADARRDVLVPALESSAEVDDREQAHGTDLTSWVSDRSRFIGLLPQRGNPDFSDRS